MAYSSNTKTMLQKSTLKFLKDLQQHNVKEWFDSNRNAYDAARTDFTHFIATVIAQYGKEDEDIASLQAKDCLFRINRDVRFSKDKSPYKTNFGASIARGGKKSIYAGYYIHIQPGNESFVGGGLWMPETEQLKKVRQEIDYNFAVFEDIVNASSFKTIYNGLYTGEDSKLSRPPKGYDDNNPAIEYLKFKSFIALHSLKDSETTEKTLLPAIIQAFSALHPLVLFLNTAVES
jgi:uncharacterized protein (TIGR02453 family)